VLLILLYLCNKVVVAVELVLLVLDIQIRDLLKEMVEQDQTFHLLTETLDQLVQFSLVVAVVVDMAMVDQELEAQAVEAQVVQHQETVQEQQALLTQVVELVDLVEIQQQELVEQAVQELSL